MKLARPILIFLNPFYWIVVFVRNLLFDFKLFKTESFNLPIIAIGNLSTGGTGKTPHTEYLIRLLKEKKRLAVLSRGYGRKTVGYKKLTPESTADEVGDEPLQIKKKYPEITVAVDADRINGVKNLLKTNPKPELILLDDAFQHRKIQAGFYVLLTSFDELYCDDWVLPGGNLREQRSGAKRANCIIVTKCPADLTTEKRKEIKEKLKPTEQQKVFFSSVCYDETFPKSFNLDDEKGFLLVTGIANPADLLLYLKNQNANFKHLSFSDHHNFTETDTQKIIEAANSTGFSTLITTEKDYQRLPISSLKLAGIEVLYLPISVQILHNSEGFEKQIQRFIQSYD